MASEYVFKQPGEAECISGQTVDSEDGPLLFTCEKHLSAYDIDKNDPYTHCYGSGVPVKKDER